MQGPKDYYKPGDYNAICDVCGFKCKSSELKLRWDGARVCAKDWEERHPQDQPPPLPRPRTPPWTRPEGEINYIEPGPADWSKL